MMWLKSVLVGFAAAIATIVLVVAIVLSRATWWADVGEGTGGVGIFSFGVSVPMLLVPVILAFAIGSGWSLRKQRRTRVVP